MGKGYIWCYIKLIEDELLQYARKWLRTPHILNLLNRRCVTRYWTGTGNRSRGDGAVIVMELVPNLFLAVTTIVSMVVIWSMEKAVQVIIRDCRVDADGKGMRNAASINQTYPSE